MTVWWYFVFYLEVEYLPYNFFMFIWLKKMRGEVTYIKWLFKLENFENKRGEELLKKMSDHSVNRGRLGQAEIPIDLWLVTISHLNQNRCEITQMSKSSSSLCYHLFILCTLTKFQSLSCLRVMHRKFSHWFLVIMHSTHVIWYL